MTPIHGNNALFSLQVGVDFFPVLCATSFSIELLDESLGASTINTGNFKEWKKRKLAEYSLSLSGLTKIDNSDGQLSWFYMAQQSVRSVEQFYQILFEDEEGNTKIISGRLLIDRLGLMADVSNFINSDISMRGNGPFDIVNIPPPPDSECSEPDADTWNTTPGEFSISGNGIEGKSFAGSEVLEVAREGLQYDYTSGAPGNRQYSYDGTNITFQWAFEPTERVHVIFKQPVSS